MTGLPDGFRLVLDPSVRSFRGGTVLIGGHPGRLITLTPDGVGQMEELLARGPASAAGRDLGRRLVDAGMAHPRAGHAAEHAAADGSVTVVVPVRDRIQALDRCLASVGAGIPVEKVDRVRRLEEAFLELVSAPVVAAENGRQS